MTRLVERSRPHGWRFDRIPFSILGAVLLWALAGTGCRSADEPVAVAQPRWPRYDFGYARDDELHLNQIQMLGTHNSYHVTSPTAAGVEELQYELPPLDEQLERWGVRQFELDLHLNGDSGEVEVYHIPVIDEGTHCRRFVDCLVILKRFSDAHPGHHPLLVMLEPKDELDGDRLSEDLSEVEAAILSVWPRYRIITPDDVQGDYPTLREAVRAGAWPTLRESRGKILFFVLDGPGGLHHSAYTHGFQDLHDRLMFITADPDAPYAAILKRDDPRRDREEITTLVRAGYLVRTRADSCCTEAATNDTSRGVAALASGAHAISTDFPAPGSAPSGYRFTITDGTPSRCNPLVAPSWCRPELIEAPDRLTGPALP